MFISPHQTLRVGQRALVRFRALRPMLLTPDAVCIQLGRFVLRVSDAIVACGAVKSVRVCASPAAGLSNAISQRAAHRSANASVRAGAGRGRGAHAGAGSSSSSRGIGSAAASESDHDAPLAVVSLAQMRQRHAPRVHGPRPPPPPQPQVRFCFMMFSYKT